MQCILCTFGNINFVLIFFDSTTVTLLDAQVYVVFTLEPSPDAQNKQRGFALASFLVVHSLYNVSHFHYSTILSGVIVFVTKLILKLMYKRNFNIPIQNGPSAQNFLKLWQSCNFANSHSHKVFPSTEFHRS